MNKHFITCNDCKNEIEITKILEQAKKEERERLKKIFATKDCPFKEECKQKEKYRRL